MQPQRKAEVFLVLTTFIAAWGWVFSRESVQGMPIFAFLGSRFLLAAVILLPFCLGKRNRIQLQQIPSILMTGGWMALNLVLWIYAVATTDSLGEGAFIMSLAMLFVPLVGWVLLKIRPTRYFWQALPVAVLGLACLTLFKGQIQFKSSQLWFLAAAIVQAIYFCYTSVYARSVPILPLTTIQLACTGIVGLMLSFFLEEWPTTIATSTLMWFIASVVIATSLRFILQLIGQKNTTAANAAIIMILEPVMTVFVAAIWYHERMPAIQILGCILILSALFYYRWRSFRLLSK
ncbi:DMT family transporter [Providencia vermicola]|uniref:DMT family transporter n=3 Tax=Providencia TaxID=586 RepID=A0AAI9MXL8_PROST|nr:MULTISPECIES: DMT family transporter [Providencia]ELR5046324.1 DMT family transporter [Providencia rettgeri]ELR5037316.1 DMT family transporter [Providencia stuartii]ELR5143274.1 DMT family transporter [Providencia stuartii]ELR5292038.1 DMT family transporter [Providencia stuartii]ELX8378890.1 DMT family transporter [Providencia stuartii]